MPIHVLDPLILGEATQLFGVNGLLGGGSAVISVYYIHKYRSLKSEKHELRKSDTLENLIEEASQISEGEKHPFTIEEIMEEKYLDRMYRAQFMDFDLERRHRKVMSPYLRRRLEEYSEIVRQLNDCDKEIISQYYQNEARGEWKGTQVAKEAMLLADSSEDLANRLGQLLWAKFREEKVGYRDLEKWLDNWMSPIESEEPRDLSKLDEQYGEGAKDVWEVIQRVNPDDLSRTWSLVSGEVELDEDDELSNWQTALKHLNEQRRLYFELQEIAGEVAKLAEKEQEVYTPKRFVTEDTLIGWLSLTQKRILQRMGGF